MKRKRQDNAIPKLDLIPSSINEFLPTVLSQMVWSYVSSNWQAHPIREQLPTMIYNHDISFVCEYHSVIIGGRMNYIQHQHEWTIIDEREALPLYQVYKVVNTPGSFKVSQAFFIEDQLILFSQDAIMVWDWNKDIKLHTFNLPKFVSSIFHVHKFHSNILYYEPFNGHLRLFNRETGGIIWSKPLNYKKNTFEIEYTCVLEDEWTFFIANRKVDIRVFDIVSGQCKATLHLYDGPNRRPTGGSTPFVVRHKEILVANNETSCIDVFRIGGECKPMHLNFRPIGLKLFEDGRVMAWGVNRQYVILK